MYKSKNVLNNKIILPGSFGHLWSWWLLILLLVRVAHTPWFCLVPSEEKQPHCFLCNWRKHSEIQVGESCIRKDNFNSISTFENTWLVYLYYYTTATLLESVFVNRFLLYVLFKNMW